MSGELRASEGLVPARPDPVRESRHRRKEWEPPTTWTEALLQGLARFAAVVAGMTAAIVLVALLFVWLKNADARTAFPRAFYIGGAILTTMAVLGGAGRGRIGPQSRSEHEIAVNRSLVYAAIGVALIGIGIALETLL
jgi:hypothetical protein